MRTRPLAETPLPLVVEPEADASAAGITAWLAERPDWVRDRLTEHGALLLRGFAIDDAPSFERVARAVAPQLKNDYLGTSPRDGLTEYVFSASELPPMYPIPQHAEMSFTRTPPDRLFFLCLVAPGGPGGETPLCDLRAVARDLDPAVRRRFEQRGVFNIRNYQGPDGGSRLDLWKLKRWDEMFHTDSRAEVERVAREQAFEVTWKSGGRLALCNYQPAFKPHPITGEACWFNHSQVFHLSAVPGEFKRIAARQGAIRYGLLGAVARAAIEVKRRLTPLEDQAMHCTYGDGSPIPDQDMEAVRDAIWKNLVCFRWQRGDVVVIDNHAVAHGRMPYRGPRKVAVAWA